MQPRAVLLGIFLCLSWAPSGNVLASKHEAASPWQGTGLDFSLLDKRLNTASCSRTERAFLSCIGVIQSLLNVHGRNLHLVPVSELVQINKSPKVVARFGEALVIEDHALQMNADSNALQVIRARSQSILRWRNRLQTGLRQGVDFTGIRQWLDAEIIDPTSREDFAAAAINGYLQVADAHARIAPAGPMGGDARAQQRGESTNNTSNELVYTGIGAGIQTMMDAALVTSVVWEGPASSAGLRAHDVILAVDSETVTGLTTEAIVAMLRGPTATQVTLTVKRQDKTLQIPIVRDSVTVTNVVSSSFVDRGWQFAYLKIYSFLRGDTCREVRRELEKRLKPTLSGLILDLRDNAGGLIDQAVCVADLFLPEDEVVLEVRNVSNARRAQQIRTRRETRVGLPMVTLVNAATASASEVLAGALQDHGRSFVVGERTFGKGTVQTARPWQGSRSVLEFFTVARYYRPGGVGVQLVGIEPDITVAEELDTARQDRIVLREGDLFPTALPREPEVWTHPNPKLATALRECTTEDGLATHRLRHKKENGQMIDYPLSVSQDTLVCSLTRRL